MKILKIILLSFLLSGLLYAQSPPPDIKDVKLYVERQFDKMPPNVKEAIEYIEKGIEDLDENLDRIKELTVTLQKKADQILSEIHRMNKIAYQFKGSKKQLNPKKLEMDLYHLEGLLFGLRELAGDK